MATITTGIYRHLKDRTRSIGDKLKLTKLVWKSHRIFLQNKEQVLIDFLTGLIFNKKRSKVSEEDACNIWRTLCELFQSTLSGKSSKIIIIKPSICQVINDNIHQQCDYHHYVVECCLNLLQSPSLSHVYNKYEQLSTLLCNILKLLVKSDSLDDIDESQWKLLQIVLPKYLQVQRSHPNQKLVFQNTTDKLLIQTLVLWNRTRKTSHEDAGDTALKVLNTAFFNKDHTSSYSVFLQSIKSDSADTTQPPKYIENFFTVLSSGLSNKTSQTGALERLRSAVLRYIPMYYTEFIHSNKITDCSTAKDIFVYICKLLDVDLQTSKSIEQNSMEYRGQHDVLEVIGSLLKASHDLDLYDRSHDPVYRQLIQILLTCDKSRGYFTCLISLLKLNHLIVEAKLEKMLLKNCSGDIQHDIERLDELMVELVQLYAKLRQMEKFITKLVNVITTGNVNTQGLLTRGLCHRLGLEVEMLPQGTAVEIWQILVQNLEDHFLSHLSKDSNFQLTEQFETFVQLMTLYVSNTKLVDYTITDINKRKVKDLMVTMAKQLEKAVHVCLTSKSKVKGYLYPVMLLMNTWGDTHLLMCQYTLHTHISIEESLDFPCSTVSAVYYFLTPDMADKLWKMVSSSYKLQYLWDLFQVQILKALCITHTRRSNVVETWNITVPDNNQCSWNQQVADINDRNYTVAKWKVFTDNFALYATDLSNIQLETCASFITDTVCKEIDSDEHLTLSSITKHFLACNAIKEHRGLITALISDVWRKMDHCIKLKFKKKTSSAESLKDLFPVLGDNAWLQKDKSFIEKIDLNVAVKKALTGTALNMDFIEPFSGHLHILSSLPLPFLEPLDQARLFVGLMVVCYHGNNELKNKCLPLLTCLVESSSSILKIVELNILLSAIFGLYVHQNCQTLAENIEFFITTFFKSVCKEGILLERMEDFVIQMRSDIANLEKELMKSPSVERSQEARLQLVSLLVQQFNMVIQRPYVREDILSLSKKYVIALSKPVFDLLYAVRKTSDKDPVIPPVTHMFSALAQQTEKQDKKLQKNSEYLVQWSIDQLRCNQTSLKVNAAVRFLKESCRLTVGLSLEVKTTILDRAFILLQQYLHYKVKNDLDKSTHDLCEELLSLVSSVIVSCDIQDFKELLCNLEQSLNIDISVTEADQVTVCMYIWYHLLSCSMSEEQSTCFMQSIHNVTGYLTSIAQQLSVLEGRSCMGKLVCDLQHQVMIMCPLTKQMILTILGSILLVPVTMETFPSMYEILNEALLNHVNTVFDIIPVFLNCSKRLLFWLIKEGDQVVLSRKPNVTTDLIGCIHMIDRLFTLISTHKEEFSKVAVYVVADYVDHVHQQTLLPAVKKALVSAIYKLLDISDKHVLAQLHTVLNQGVREVFKGLYSDYSNFYKYTGRV
ncbi:unhealthy ribosome biogenesis protein 2 homolog isoform X5 [Mytilus californianus]|uniref:unhealthy ribosome biogenesis protein 2 homolog isoform X1 n=1 Tax=Mytilus californianus TaxID=6549 RepID=UPI0022484E1D|nr:unhealthy ribosome biogenesis protein 2 homolog isoform X1 [Mytilus californianus]XP_052102856.1 unhealthy ribosome biogenesis protein 2 homolog isoform X4 [Mytilus californianus]XP_052102865.1 unhealthy ribosome biogenesis protein 2 homolog isoform X5 [Mytilus californianus]